MFLVILYPKLELVKLDW